MPWVLIIDALKHEDVHMFKTTPDKVYAKSPSCSNMQLTAVLTIRLKKMTEEYKIQSYQRHRVINWDNAALEDLTHSTVHSRTRF